MDSTYISYEEQDELGTALVKAREKGSAKNKPYVDIFALAESFGLTVRFENFAEEDATKDGFLSDGAAPVRIWSNGQRVNAVFPSGTIVIDSYLRRPNMETKLRFTVAHEIAHYIGNIHQRTASFHSEFDAERTYDPEEFRQMFGFQEIQANNLGGILLTPSHKLQKVYKKVTGGKLLTQYGDRTIDADTREKIAEMAKMMKVSQATMRIRLERLKLFKKLPIDQYVESGRFDLDNYSLFQEGMTDELPF